MPLTCSRQTVPGSATDVGDEPLAAETQPLQCLGRQVCRSLNGAAAAGSSALVTGAAGDIGEAVAMRLVASGVGVVLADHPDARDRLTVVERRCREFAPDVVTTTALFDVTDRTATEAALASIGEQAAAPNLLCNNAGFQGGFANIIDAALDDVTKVMDVNVVGVFSVLQVFARALRAAERSGAIVNTASMAGVSGAPNMTGYSASKAAVVALTKSAAKDLAGFGIRVNAVSPGFIGPGAMWHNQVRAQAAVPSLFYADDEDAVAAQMMAQIPLRRCGHPSEVAEVVAFLLSDAASYLTGVNIEIAGGAT